jgi:hypothetical protein
MDKAATEVFRKTLEENDRLPVADALLLALYEAVRTAGTREVSIKFVDGDLETAEVRCG